MTPKEQALNCINRGFSVIAGYPPGKSERAVIKGTSSGTLDEITVSEWFDEMPNRNIMINLRNSGLICIDLDQHQNGQNGRNVFSRLWNKHSEGEILSTYVEKTPTGNGLHVFFKVPKELFNQPIVNELADGVEIKTHFTPIYPSKRTDGDYIPLNDTETNEPLTFDSLCDCPDWLLEMIQRPQKRQNPTLGSRTYSTKAHEKVTETTIQIAYFTTGEKSALITIIVWTYCEPLTIEPVRPYLMTSWRPFGKAYSR